MALIELSALYMIGFAFIASGMTYIISRHFNLGYRLFFNPLAEYGFML